MKKIAMFTNTFAPLVGGVERSVANAHEDLNALGHLCRVVTPEFKGAEFSRRGVLRLPAITGLGEKEFSVALPMPRLEHWMEALEPDLLHTHQPFLLGETAWRIGRRRQIPVVFTYHTLYERYAHYLLVDSERTRQLMMALTHHYANRCQLVIAPTESIRRLIVERGVTAPVEVSPTGIDLELYASGSRARGRSALGLQSDDEVAGHLGRLSQEKNVNFVVEAAIQVLRARPAAKFLLVGEGDRLDWARTRFAGEGLGGRLIAPGTLAGEAVADAYAAMDVFLFASHTDTQGLVLAETMAAGVPVVALDAPGARDVVSEGRTGRLLAPEATVEEFAVEVDRLLARPEERQRMSEVARREALRFGRLACARRLLEVYGRALSEYRPQSDAAGELWDQAEHSLAADWAPLWEKLKTVVRTLSGAESPRGSEFSRDPFPARPQA